MKAVVLAGGTSEDLRPLTGELPKTHLKILGSSVLSHVISRLIASGIREIYVVSDEPEKASEDLRPYARTSSIEVVEQKGRGVEAALLSAWGRLKLEPGERFMLVYGDIIVNPSAYISVRGSLAPGLEGAVLAVPETPLQSHGVLEVDEAGIVRSVKQATEAKAGEATYISGGIYVLGQELLESVERLGNIVSAFDSIVRSGKVVAVYWGHYWVNIGTPWDLLTATYHMLGELDRSYISSRASISRTAVIEGPVYIDEEASVDHNSVLKGPLYIGREAFVGVNSFLRNYTSVEERGSIGSYSEINRSMVMGDATVGRASYIGYSVVGERSVIEPNTVTWNIVLGEQKRPQRGSEYAKLGCVVARGARVRAGSILRPGEVVRAHE